MALSLMETLPDLDDQELVDRTLAGERDAFQVLVERHQDRLFGLVRHYTRNPVEIEDIVQESFLKAYTRLESFQRQGSFYTWIYRIAVNTTLDLFKRQGRKRTYWSMGNCIWHQSGCHTPYKAPPAPPIQCPWVCGGRPNPAKMAIRPQGFFGIGLLNNIINCPHVHTIPIIPPAKRRSQLSTLHRKSQITNQ